MIRCEVKKEQTKRIVRMKDMRPYDIGIIKDASCQHDGEIVMRTASLDNREVMLLSDAAADRRWQNSSCVEVELFPPGTEVVLTVK